MNFSPEFANHLSILACRHDYNLSTFSALPVSESIHLLRCSLYSDAVKIFAVFGRDVLDLALLDSDFRTVFDPSCIGVGDPYQYLGAYSDIHCFFSCHAHSKAFMLLSLTLYDKDTWSTSNPVLKVVDVKTYLLN